MKYPARNRGPILRLRVALLAAEAGVIILLRSGCRLGIDLVRGFNKRILHPVMPRLGGRRHWYAAPLHHVGRRSGRSYTTSIVAERIGEKVSIPLPYGREVDWCRNLEAAGWGEMELGGVRYDLREPSIVSAETVAPLLSPHRLRTLNLLGVEEFLSLGSAPCRHAR